MKLSREGLKFDLFRKENDKELVEVKVASDNWFKDAGKFSEDKIESFETRPGDLEAASSKKEPANAATYCSGKYRDLDGRGPKPCKFGLRIRSGSLPAGGNNATNRRLI